ncbi:MAG: phenylacetate--CoA ligase family protein [Acidobacteria bacterium]|nr:phenylacetate--CoA ligase family protein [Acidobacteriota bacterium]MBI3423712.1 phenylacetate--CoA ligase family protein [Acidobacteriota bacterium]
MQSVAEARALQAASRTRLRAWQDERLRVLLRELVTNQFYAHKFQAAGLPLATVTNAAGLARLPFTTKNELAEEQLAHPPYGRLLTYPLSEYRYLHQTSGTTGRSLKWLDTAADWESFLRCWAEVYRGAGVNESDLVFFAFSFGPYISHWTGIDGARYVGALALSGGGMGSEQRLRAIIENRCTVLVCTPTYALHLAEVAARVGIDLHASDIRLTIHAGEPGASVPNVKRRIEAAWGAPCFDHAGATEVGAWAFDCQAEDGAMHLNELEFIFEVIDPQTAEPVAEGVRGELVITTLSRPGMPVLRYRTGDLVELTTEPCACGRTLARIKGGVLGRADDMLSVRGVNVYPAAIDNLLKALPSVVEYEVEIRRVEEMDDLLLKVETTGALAFAEVERAIRTAFRTQLNIRVNVEQAAALSLPRYEFKARRFKRIAE